MRNANSEHEPERAAPDLPPEIEAALQTWHAPRVPSSLDTRVLASYRQQLTRVPFWRRFFSTSIAVPLPLVVVQAILLVVATAAVIMFFQDRGQSNVPLAEQQRPAEIIPVPITRPVLVVRSETARRILHQRPLKKQKAIVPLPPNNELPLPLASAEVITRESLQPLPVTTLEAPVVIASEQRLGFTPALNFKLHFPDPLRFDLPAATPTNEFILETSLEKASFFDHRISRPLSRASNWVMTKPLEKGAVLYRAIPRTIPTLNSFIAPAKDACLAPFRSNAPVNVQIN